MIKRIQGVDINLSHPDISEAKNLEALKNLALFSHIDTDLQDAAYKELWNELHPVKNTGKE